MDLLKEIPSESIDITITSPPYCMGKEYEHCRDINTFIDSHRELLPVVIDRTRPGGSICWQTGYHVKDNTIIPLDYLVHDVFRHFPEMVLRNRIIWTFGHGAHLSRRFSGRHEVILWYTKGNNYYFDLDAVRVPQKYPGKRHYKGPNKGNYSGNPLGKNPADVWDIPHVKANHMEKTDHPCQFPVALAHRLVRALCPRNGRVFDPYVGSGTTGVASVIEERVFVGSELNLEYCHIAENRIGDAILGKAKYREAAKPIYEPNGESVARKPSHFS